MTRTVDDVMADLIKEVDYEATSVINRASNPEYLTNDVLLQEFSELNGMYKLTCRVGAVPPRRLHKKVARARKLVNDVMAQSDRQIYVAYQPGDKVQILVGGPHENYLRTATVNRVQENGDVVVYFGDRDEDEWVYSPNELKKV